MQDWSKKAKEGMRWLGNFNPTINAGYKQVKGYMLDSEGDAGKVYLDSRELRELGDSFVEVARWLEERAELEKEDL